MARITREQVEQELTNAGFLWVGGEYHNLDSILTLKCVKHGHESLASLKQIRKGYLCPNCEQDKECQSQEIKLQKLPPKQGRRILVLDQATTVSGFAIYEDNKLIYYGIKKAADSDITVRIKNVKEWFVAMIKTYEIDIVGLENIQLQQNVETFMKLAKLLGVLEVTALEHTGELPYVKNSSEWFAWCGLKAKERNKRKQLSQQRVKEKFGLKVSQDCADAINLGNYLSVLDTVVQHEKNFKKKSGF